MSVSDELKELLRQKREIEDKIKALHEGVPVEIGNVKLDKEHYPTTKPDRYFVAVRSTYRDGNTKDSLGRDRWSAIINGTDRQAVIDQIPERIKELQALYDKLMERSDL